MTAKERIEQLEATVAELSQKLAALGVTPGQPVGPWEVRVGGQPVAIRALSPAQWAAALQDLPAFLFMYAAGERGKEAQGDVLERTYATAQQWLLACAIDPSAADLGRLTVPEAAEAIKRIAALNGIDAHLGEVLQKKMLQRPSTRPPGATA